jgi:hypothetical protein
MAAWLVPCSQFEGSSSSAEKRLIAHNDLSQFYLANGLDLISEIEARHGRGETNVKEREHGR